MRAIDNREITVRLRKLHGGQQQIRREARRYNVLACGRRWGKTCWAEDRIAEVTLDRRGKYGYFVPTYKLLLDVWDSIISTFKPVIRRSNTTERRVELITGGIIEMWSFESEEVARSRSYHEAFIDEAGLVPDLLTRWHEEILPTLADHSGGAWFAGTPKGRNGFYTLWQRGQDTEEADWMSWRFPTVSNPHIKAAEVEQMAREMPQRAYQQEILAEFLEDGCEVFRNVAAQSILQPSAPVAGDTYVMGADWARSDDYTVFSVINARTGQQVALDRFSEIGYEVQYARFKALCETWKPVIVQAEYNSMGGPLVERAQADGYPVLGFVTTNASKKEAIEALALALERRHLYLLADATQRAELEAYAIETLPSGLIRYSAPEGMHDDTVMALALGWQAALPYAVTHDAVPETAEETEARRNAEFEATIARLTGGRPKVRAGW